MVWFLPTVAHGDQLLSSSSIVVFALNGEASVESSTFIYPRAEAVFVLVRVLGHISGLCIHPTMNVVCAGHFSCGSGLAPSTSSGPLPAAGGFYSFFNSCCDHAHTTLPLWASLFGSTFKVLSHISPFSYGRCSLISALSRMGMAVMARSLRPCRHTRLIALAIPAHADSHTTLPN